MQCVLSGFSHVRLFATLWAVAHQAPVSMEYSRQEYQRWLPFPSLGDLPNPGIKPLSPALQADTLPSEPPGKLCIMFPVCTVAFFSGCLQGVCSFQQFDYDVCLGEGFCVSSLGFTEFQGSLSVAVFKSYSFSS